MNKHNAAKVLKSSAARDGIDLSDEDALLLAEVAEKVAADLKFQEERRQDVANHCAELRSFGLWDGE